MSAKESATYKAMLDEVEALSREMGHPDLDLDSLVEKVERGYTLIEAMRARLDATKMRLEELHLRYEPKPE